MKVLFLALGDLNHASSRIRAWRFVEHLAKLGVDARCFRGSDRNSLLHAFAFGRTDVTVVQKWTPPKPVMRILRRRSKILIFDCDDAIYLGTSTGQKESLALRNSARLRSFISMMDGVTVSTDLMARDFDNLRPGIPTLVFPGPIPDEEFEGAKVSQRQGVMWLGSPATEKYLSGIAPSLLSVQDSHGFVAVGAGEATARAGIATLPWTQETERSVLAKAAVGIFVQADGEWERRKSGYKLFEYIRAGVIPVAEDQSAARDILGSDYPFLVRDEQWEETIRLACGLSVSDREVAIKRLQERIRKFDYRRTIERWIEFISEELTSK